MPLEKSERKVVILCLGCRIYKQNYQYCFVRQSDMPTKSHPDWSGFFGFFITETLFMISVFSVPDNYRDSVVNNQNSIL